jgi:trimeric autotransporter adhesin
VDFGRLVQRAGRHTRKSKSLRRRALRWVSATHKTSFLGTALASTLFLGSLYASTPVFAQSEAVVIGQSNFASDNTLIDKQGDVSLGLTRFFNQTNSAKITITNSDPITEDIFTQFGVINQSNRAESSIAIINSGDINATLANSISQANADAVTLTNSAAPAVEDIFAQIGVVDQSNRFDSSIAISNSGEVNAALTNSVSQTNTGTAAITNTAPVSIADSFTQSIERHESNVVASSIAIANTRRVEAGNIGISAAIANADIVQINDSAITLESQGVLNADSFTQAAEAHQTNAVTSSIAITNAGQVNAGDIGISATITNADITQINFNTITVDSSGDVNANNSAQSAELDQRNDITSSIAIVNNGLVKGSDIGIFAQTTSELIDQFDVSPAALSALPNDLDVQLIDISQANKLVDSITITNSGSVFGGSFGIAAAGGTANIANTGLVRAYAQDPNAAPTGIGVIAAETTITNRAGTIWAGFSTDGGANIHRGVAIENASAGAHIQLQGTEADGHIYGDINIASSTTIETTQGKTWFEGTINGIEGALEIFGGGKLVLCQEGWISSCDANAWDTNWDPQEGADQPSLVFIDTLRVHSDGAIVHQLTPRTAPGTYPQVFANTATLSGTLEANYLPGFYANEFHYQNVIETGSRIGSFARVDDNSLLLTTEAIYDGNNVDLSVKRTAFDKVSGLTENQSAVGGGIEHIYSKLPGTDVNPAATDSFAQMVAKLFTIDNKHDYSAVLNQLTGAQYAQELQSMLWSLRPLNEAITDRMDCRLNHNVGPVATGYDSTLSAYRPYGCFRPGQVQTWARVWGGWNNNDGDLNAPGYDETQRGIWGGADYALADTVSFGFVGGFFWSDMDFERFGGVPGASIKYDGGQIAGYAIWDNSVWYDRSIVSAGFYRGDSHRSFALQSPAVDPNGSPDADAVSFYNEMGRRFGVGSNVMLTPFVGVSVASAELDSFTERDPQNTGTALKVFGNDANSVASILGLRLSSSWGGFMSQLAMGWEHEFEDTFHTLNAAFAAAPSGSNFRVIAADLKDDAFVVDAGVSYTLSHSSDLSVRYVGRFLEDYDAGSVMGRWTYKFGAAPLGTPPSPPARPPLK